MRPNFPSFNLPFWMDGTEARKLADAARIWFSRLGVWAELPLSQSAPLSCTERVLVLLAWQRGIGRVAGETDRSYRLRVAHAYANGRDAGQTEGWKRIFQRLELGTPELEERVPGQDWDIIGVILPDKIFGRNQPVIERIVEDYGRTCRRYRFVSRSPVPIHVRCVPFDDCQTTLVATPNGILSASWSARYAALDSHWETAGAVKKDLPISVRRAVRPGLIESHSETVEVS